MRSVLVFAFMILAYGSSVIAYDYYIGDAAGNVYNGRELTYDGRVR